MVLRQWFAELAHDCLHAFQVALTALIVEDQVVQDLIVEKVVHLERS